ncbi:MAG: AhpC/TSA family protein [Culturomica sp.]|nr:AhpC/TSA family protein [Culturomica sp.]
MIKRILLLLLPAVSLLSCRPGNVEISGQTGDAANTKAYLERQDVDRIVPVDSVKIGRSGKFSFRVQVTDPVYYNVRIGKEAPVTVIAEAGKKILIEGEQTGWGTNYRVSGSEASELIRELVLQLHATTTAMDSLQKKYRALPGEPAHDAERNRLAAAWDSVVSGQIRFSRNFTIEHAVSPAAYYALYQKLTPDSFVLDPVSELTSYKAVLSSLMAFYPQSPYTKALSGHYEQIRKNIQSGRIRSLIEQSENTLPAIRLADQNGKEQTLESLKGNYILLDFTLLTAQAAQSHTNDLKQAYARYHAKGLEIFQVCLDSNKLLWEEALKNSGINWICLLDPEGAESRAARSWNIQGIPANYLINRQYEIVGKNLYGQRLRDRLADVIK